MCGLDEKSLKKNEIKAPHPRRQAGNTPNAVGQNYPKDLRIAMTRSPPSSGKRKHPKESVRKIDR